MTKDSMQKIKERIKYLQGLAEGLNISETSQEGKILSEMLDILADLSTQVNNLERDQRRQDTYIDSNRDDIDGIQAFFQMILGTIASFGEVEDLEELADFDMFDLLLSGLFDDEDYEDDEGEEEYLIPFIREELLDDVDEDDVYIVTCQNCGKEYEADFEDFDTDSVICPYCHKPYRLKSEIIEELKDEDD